MFFQFIVIDLAHLNQSVGEWKPEMFTTGDIQNRLIVTNVVADQGTIANKLNQLEKRLFFAQTIVQILVADTVNPH
ncbi:Uncharacterised protein [Vibrio cholerae]|nr:Uncharacterised protein [Vibrio cholerae]CSB33157.1 Uncharacterised protein [Vibrio cholerae]CSB86159.1 Uncharacterised protein [Vibrio cholerae]CSC41831.1 Uncharacterised protein [Vibrio cholerae]